MICIECGRKFEQKLWNNSRNFCSKRCYRFNKKPFHTCKTCGMEYKMGGKVHCKKCIELFKFKPKKVKKDKITKKVKYCKKKYYNPTEKIEKECEICNLIFLGKKNQIICKSKECKKNYQKLYYKKVLKERRRKAKLQ